ncbi:HlyD family secretion protein [Brasilonema octagenarum UFV-E1]|jgi:membrane fusion protein (multidrug efflux system)|uniref:HlyD family secretion protein n=2 Tax=Brasilonema TaxID=383614 RepID=A0A856MHX1_9CYAN|nr:MULTISPECIES: HlyD family secretion protein [Brasilonema]NMF66728.1 HlyD family secretion protein [Brasilonema octagenarum UFV-OR1]QDL09231.1 HlyD family secretion protein [Brasilonema sennae CENA114]QDL15590.1 HlyD family secretion protein [Brasilonema octagenarum UFV-E1]
MEHRNSSPQTHRVTGLEGQKPVSEEKVTAITTTNSESEIQKPVPRSKRNALPKVILAVLLAGGAIAAGIYAFRTWQYNQQYARKYQETDNAYVTANVSPITSRVSGIVTEVTVNDNQVVSANDVLMKIDKRDYLVSLTQAKASLELAKQQAELARERLNRDIVSASASNSDPANNNQAKQVATNAQQREIHQQQYKIALAAVAQKQADLRKAELQLSYTDITALVPGKVGNKSVSVGQQVQPGQTLITLVQPNPWIIANFKETQLEKIQPGQNVTITIPAFPNRTFSGKVDSMSPTSFGKVALPPQENATGYSNLPQDVQRVPVKIVFEPKSLQGYESRMTPGMSAVAVVETNNSLPAQKAPNLTPAQNAPNSTNPKDTKDTKNTNDTNTQEKKDNQTKERL